MYSRGQVRHLCGLFLWGVLGVYILRFVITKTSDTVHIAAIFAYGSALVATACLWANAIQFCKQDTAHQNQLTKLSVAAYTGIVVASFGIIVAIGLDTFVFLIGFDIAFLLCAILLWYTHRYN